MANLNRTNGMIWIDKDSPYRLKYHIHDEDYTVETSVTYKCPVTEGKSLSVGTVVKLTEGDKIAPALFPVDLFNVLGIILATEEGVDQVPVSVGKIGSIIIPKADLSKVFVARDLSENSFNSQFSPIIGAPVYWDCGFTNGTTYTAPLAGKLTIQTPSGFKYHQKSLVDDKLNIGYNNLPQVGTIVNITNDSIEIHLNFSTFDSTIEWFWPAIGENAGSLIANTTEQTFFMYHGLFAPTDITDTTETGTITTSSTVRCPCKITAQKDNDDLEILAHFSHTPGVENTRSSYTSITYNIPEALTHVYVSGEVIYGFNKY